MAVRTQDGFVRHMAHHHADFWGWHDIVGLCPMANRIRFFCAEIIALELTTAEIPGPIAADNAGWMQLARAHRELRVSSRGSTRTLRSWSTRWPTLPPRW